jgi:hypothetical protein
MYRNLPLVLAASLSPQKPNLAWARTILAAYLDDKLTGWDAAFAWEQWMMTSSSSTSR